MEYTKDDMFRLFNYDNLKLVDTERKMAFAGMPGMREGTV